MSLPSTPRLIKIAILAMGGEGGGVLADWLVDLAEHAGHMAQTTSVPGVAQRTGSTTYYLGRTILTPRGHSELAGWQKRLFCTMSQAGSNNPLHFSIPPGRMVELGIQIDL